MKILSLDPPSSSFCLIWIVALKFLQLGACQLLNATASLKELPVLLLTSIKCCDAHVHMQILQQVRLFFFLEF